MVGRRSQARWSHPTTFVTRMTATIETIPAITPTETWQQRLAIIVDAMQELSRHSDPQEMVRAYGEMVRQLVPSHQRVSLSRRGLSYPHYRITRSTRWSEEINPWKQRDRLPLLSGGLFARLIYSGEPVVIDDIVPSPDDPAAEYLEGIRSLLAIPMYDQGDSLNMVVLLGDRPCAFDRNDLPDLVWRSNLFGRATGNLVLRQELQKAYEDLDREMKIVADIQRSLLPAELPKIPSLDLATFYRPSRRAGGDYYDFFPLPDGRWGIFVGDVSGHGTPAAVLMAVTHCIAHTLPGPPAPPSKVLGYLNEHLVARYTGFSSSFVTAFYAIYDPAALTLTYACAGHNPPRLKRCQDGSLLVLDRCDGLPLGVAPGIEYDETTEPLEKGDQIIFYTDGITEAHNIAGELFGTARLDEELENCSLQASSLLEAVLHSVERFTAGRAILDDQTLIVARVV
jgi:sigma-B regulation protein RsbU (phosphoserine phosphatase)